MKRGKKYIEAAKQQSLTRQSRLTSEQVVTDVMQISRSAARLFFRTEQVKKFAFLYLQKTQRQKKQKQQELIL